MPGICGSRLQIRLIHDVQFSKKALDLLPLTKSLLRHSLSRPRKLNKILACVLVYLGDNYLFHCCNRPLVRWRCYEEMVPSFSGSRNRHLSTGSTRTDRIQSYSMRRCLQKGKNPVILSQKLFKLQKYLLNIKSYKFTYVTYRPKGRSCFRYL